jgi:hypothetical protein
MRAQVSSFRTVMLSREAFKRILAESVGVRPHHTPI